MSQNNEIPNIQKLEDVVTLSDTTILSMEQYFHQMCNTRNKEGQIDFNVMQYYTAYNIGENYNRVNALILQAEHKLIDLNASLVEAQAHAIDDIKRGKSVRGYDLTTAEAKVFQDAHPEVLKYQRAVDKQSSVISFLKKQLEAIKYYPSNVKTIREMYEAHLQYGSAK